MPEFDAAERVQQFVNAFAEENPRAETVDPAVNMLTVSSNLPDLTVADLRALLKEVRSLRGRVLDPADTYLVTVKLPKNPAHDPRAKQTGQCQFSDECTDVTGEHHTVLTDAAGVELLRASGTWITRTELLRRSPDFLRAESAAPVRPGWWATEAEIPAHVAEVQDSFGQTWTKQFLKRADGGTQWRLPGSRFGGPLPVSAFPVREA